MQGFAMVQAGTIRGMPEFLAAQVGEKPLERVFAAADLPMQLTVDPERYIGWSQLMRFVEAVGREIGDEDVGLLLAPKLNLETWGAWGSFVMAAPTLAECFQRMSAAMPFHGRHERLTLEDRGDDVLVVMKHSISGAPLYDHIAFCAAGLMLGAAAEYLGPDWRPAFLGLDVDRRRSTSRVEQTFRTAARFGADGVCLPIPRHLWLSGRRRPAAGIAAATMADIVRARFGGPPRSAAAAVAETVRVQLLDASASLDQAAKNLDVSTRSLQRELRREGASFRRIARQVRARRAAELLRDTRLPISRIGADLGYSSVAHFGRAFAAEIGCTPSEHRRRSRRSPALGPWGA